MVAGQLHRVTALTAELARDAFFTYWEGEGREHLREEEDILLPVYGRYASPDHPLVARVLCEHVTIRGLAAAISDASTPIAMLQELGLVLSDHACLEERSLFPLIEQAVPPAALEQVAARLAYAPA